MVRKKAIDSVGPFDENLFLYGEEPDFCYRLRRADWELYFLRHVRIVHYKGQSIKQVGKVIPRSLRSFIYVMQKIARDKWDRKPLAHMSGMKPLN